jgi:hypothetical protein
MKRLHVHLAVENIDSSVRFYSQLVASEPTVRKPDYARWVLEGGAMTCCYATSEKRWSGDPHGVKWETFLTSGESSVHGSEEPAVSAQGCCEPRGASAPAPPRCCG